MRSPPDKLLPFTHKTVKINIDIALRVKRPTFSDDECFFFIFISQPKMNFAFYKHNATLLDHSIYRFIFDVGKKVDPGTVEFFLKRMIEITHPCFCFATSDTHWYARCIVKYVHVQGTKEHHIKLNDKVQEKQEELDAVEKLIDEGELKKLKEKINGVEQEIKDIIETMDVELI